MVDTLITVAQVGCTTSESKQDCKRGAARQDFVPSARLEKSPFTRKIWKGLLKDAILAKKQQFPFSSLLKTARVMDPCVQERSNAHCFQHFRSLTILRILLPFSSLCFLTLIFRSYHLVKSTRTLSLNFAESCFQLHFFDFDRS